MSRVPSGGGSGMARLMHNETTAWQHLEAPLLDTFQPWDI
jgi:hypothetical protein